MVDLDDDDNEEARDPTVLPKLTEWENEPDVSTLRADLEAARMAHDKHVSRIRRWNDLNQVKGSARPQKVKGRSSVQPKLIRRQAEWRYAALTEPFLSSDKLFTVEPVTFEDKLAAEQNELVLNYQFRTKLNRVKFIDDFIRTNVDEGSAIVRVGWNRTTVMEEVEVPVWEYRTVTTQEEVDILDQAQALLQSDPRAYEASVAPEIKAALEFTMESQQPVVAVQVGAQMESVERVIDNRPTVEIMNPENVFIDPSAGPLIDDAGFVVVSIETSQAALRKQTDRYKNLDKVNWDHISLETENDHSSSTEATFNFKDAARKRVVAYEYWGTYDIHGTGVLVPIVATWVGGVMIRMEENPFPDGKPPFVVTSYLPTKREMLGEPDAELLEDNQNINGALMRGLIDLFGRSANAQHGFQKGMLDPVNMRKFNEGRDYEFNPNSNPQSGFVEHKYPDVPQSAMVMLQLQNQEAEALTGVKSFSGGLSGEAFGDVAAGVRGMLDAASKREMAILRRMAHGVKEIGTKIALMNAVFLSEQEVVRITNSEFVTVNREDLAGNFDLEVDISTAEIDNAKAQDLGFMLQTIGNNMDFGITQIILTEIARLKRMPSLSQAIKQFQPQPDPLTEKLRELEVQEKELSIYKLQAEIKALEARAVKDLAVADKTELDVAEQGSGIKHERDMEKQRGQAEGNQDLEITKALVKSRKEGERDPDIEAGVGFNTVSKSMRSPGSLIQRNDYGQNDPRLSLRSKHYDPSIDPASNLAINI